MNIMLVMPVWGDDYIDLLETIALPSQLGGANLRQIGRCDSASCLFLTRAADRQRISDIADAHNMSDHMSVEVRVVENLGDDVSQDGLPYNWLRVCQNMALTAAREKDAALVFLTADALVTQGSIAWAIRQWRDGARAVLVPSLQVERPAYRASIESWLLDQDIALAAMDTANAVRLALPCLHAHFRATRIDARPFLNSWPSALWWPVEEEGLVMRAFHMHPLLIEPVDRDREIETSFDDGFVDKACPDPETIRIVSDSNEALLISLEDPDYYNDALAREDEAINMQKLVSWAISRFDNTAMRCFVDHPVTIHTGGIHGQLWQDRLTGSRNFVGHFMDAISEYSRSGQLRFNESSLPTED